MDFLGPLAPLGVDLILAVGLAFLIIVDVALPVGEKKSLSWGALAVVVGALAGTWLFDISGTALSGVYEGDSLALFMKRLFLTSGALSILASIPFAAEHYPRRQGEFFQLMICSLLGMTLLAGARDMLLLVVCFELMGIPLYILAAYSRRDSKSVEGALKLLLTGAVSTAITLFGLSFLFGLAQSTQLNAVAAYVAQHPSALALMGGTLAVAGMGFKIGVFPFHMWVPDTYEGAKTPVVLFLSVGPKAAGIVALVQLLYAGDATLLKSVTTVLVALAAVTLVAGNVAALNQSNVKRILAFSGVGHMGFLLMAMVAGGIDTLGLSSLLFYLAGYLFTNLGAFLVVHSVEQAGGDDTVSSFDGLGERSGFLSLAMLLFLLSLAGIPFVVGFWAKLYVFIAAWKAGMEILVVLGALFSVLALFYYLRIARAMFMNSAGEKAVVFEPDTPTTLAIAFCLVFVIGMGVQPRPFIEAAESAAADYLAGKNLTSAQASEGEGPRTTYGLATR